MWGTVERRAETWATSQAFTQSVVDRIFDEIRKSKLVVFVASGQNPNVFFEAGYAIALRKEVVTVTDRFDRHAIAYGNDPKSVETALMKKLASLTEIHEI